MSDVNERIEAAWRRCPLNTLGRPAGESFKAGAKAGIAIGRDLYVEVKPEDVKHGQIYYASWPGQPVREVYCGDEYFSYWEQGGVGPNGEIEHIERSVNPDICKVYELNLPSPSEVFGGVE